MGRVACMRLGAAGGPGRRGRGGDRGRSAASGGEAAAQPAQHLGCGSGCLAPSAAAHLEVPSLEEPPRRAVPVVAAVRRRHGRRPDPAQLVPPRAGARAVAGRPGAAGPRRRSSRGEHPAPAWQRGAMRAVLAGVVIRQRAAGACGGCGGGGGETPGRWIARRRRRRIARSVAAPRWIETSSCWRAATRPPAFWPAARKTPRGTAPYSSYPPAPAPVRVTRRTLPRLLRFAGTALLVDRTSPRVPPGAHRCAGLLCRTGRSRSAQRKPRPGRGPLMARARPAPCAAPRRPRVSGSG